MMFRKRDCSTAKSPVESLKAPGRKYTKAGVSAVLGRMRAHAKRHAAGSYQSVFHSGLRLLIIHFRFIAIFFVKTIGYLHVPYKK